jgi:hypothetical protein
MKHASRSIEIKDGKIADESGTEPTARSPGGAVIGG